MKRQSTIKIAIVLILAVVMGVFLVLYFSGKKAPKTDIQSGTEYNAEVRELEKEKQALRSLAGGLGVNYLARFPESSQMDISFFMFNRISGIANRWGVELLSYSPAEKEPQGDFTRISFSYAISASYDEMILFLRDLEEKERLRVKDFKLTRSSRDPGEHKIEFVITCLESQDLLLHNLEAKEDTVSPSSVAQADKAVKRDPFFNPFETKGALPQFKAQEGYLDLSRDLVLTGISFSSRSKTAIINHKLVKEGDVIEGKRVMKIKKDQVKLKAGDQLYILRLKEISPSQKENSFGRDK